MLNCCQSKKDPSPQQNRLIPEAYKLPYFPSRHLPYIALAPFSSISKREIFRLERSLSIQIQDAEPFKVIQFLLTMTFGIGGRLIIKLFDSLKCDFCGLFSYKDWLYGFYTKEEWWEIFTTPTIWWGSKAWWIQTFHCVGSSQFICFAKVFIIQKWPAESGAGTWVSKFYLPRFQTHCFGGYLHYKIDPIGELGAIFLRKAAWPKSHYRHKLAIGNTCWATSDRAK